MEKKELRKQQIAKLQAYAETAEKKREDQLLLERLLNSDLLEGAEKIGVTSSLNFEVDTSGLIASLWDQGKEVFLARANSDRTMDFLAYNYNTKLKVSKFGVSEVADPQAQIENDLDVLVVPGLAYDCTSHYRLGFGGGYYDRFLAKHQVKSLVLANSKMIYQKPVWPVEAFDMPINYLVTTEEIIGD